MGVGVPVCVLPNKSGIGEIGFLASVSTSELTSRTNTLHIDKLLRAHRSRPGPDGVSDSAAEEDEQLLTVLMAA
jgi:hypothetical protein